MEPSTYSYHTILLPLLNVAPFAIMPLSRWLALRCVDSATYDVFISYVYPRFRHATNTWLAEAITQANYKAFRVNPAVLSLDTLALLIQGRDPSLLPVTIVGRYIELTDPVICTRDSPHRGRATLTNGGSIDYFAVPHVHGTIEHIIDSMDFAILRAWFDGARLHIADWTAFNTDTAVLTIDDVCRYRTVTATERCVCITECAYDLDARLEVAHRCGLEVNVTACIGD